jgi:PKD repeat protein
MKLKKRFSISFLLSLLCMAFLANGQISPIAVVGTDTLCPTSSATYLTTPLTGIHFIWTVTPLALVGMTPIGTISGPNNLDSVSVFWGLAGMARVRVWGYDSANVLVDTGSIVVTVLHAPAPFITENVRVGCQQLTDTSQGDVKRPGGIIDDKYGCIKVCEGSIVTYTGWGAATDTFGWVIVGGTIITAGADTCQVKWGYTGMGSVTVFDTSQYGCIGQKHVCIEIIPKPHALFKIMPASSPSYCLGQSLVFVDHSVDSGGSPIVSWFWDFGDGTLWPASSSTSLTHEYSVAGTYTAKLIVTNACGCKDTFRMKINISEKAGVNIICPGVSCQGAIDSYSLSPVITCTSYIWTAIGGTIVTPMGPSIAVQWNSVDTSGFGYLFFNSGPCTTCPGLTTIKVPVILSHGHISGPKKVCADNAYLFNMPQWPSTVFNWTVTGTATATLAHTDQNNQMVMYPHGSGVIYLKCTYNNTLLGCGGTAIDTITILPPDSIIGQAKVCLNDSSSYSLAGVPGITGDWSIVYPDGMTILTGTGHTSPAFPFTQVGTYILTVVPDIMSVPAFCSIAPFLVTVGPLPVTPDGITGPDTVCYGTPINYTAYNPIAGDIFEWTISAGTINFVDGNTTVATFAGAGPDIIAVRRATMSSPHCYSHYFNKLVARPFVHPHITGLDTVCPSSLSIYDGNYYEGETYSWKVYPSTMGSVQTDGFSGAGILWNNTSGPATIVVTIRKCSLNYTDTFHVWVRAMPLTFSITLSADSICRGASITATAGIGGTIAWSWGDSSVLTSADSVNPASHIYHILAGHNLVDTLTAISTNPWGCLAVVIAKRAVIILPAPVAFISPAGPYNYCVGSPSETLTATIQSGYEPTDSLLWMRTTTTVPIIGCITPFPCAAQTFTTWGVYYVIAEGINGCRDTSNYVSIDSVDCSGGTGGTCTLTPEPTVGLSVSSHCGIVTLTGSYSALPTELSTTWNYPFLDATIISMSPTVLTCSFRTTLLTL